MHVSVRLQVAAQRVDGAGRRGPDSEDLVRVTVRVGVRVRVTVGLGLGLGSQLG